MEQNKKRKTMGLKCVKIHDNLKPYLPKDDGNPIRVTSLIKQRLESDEKTKFESAYNRSPSEDSFLLRAMTKNAFVETVHRAYESHLPLLIRPDDIWLCVVRAIASCVNQDPERYRNIFVEHEGKRTITIRRDEFRMGSDSNDWAGCLDEFSLKLKAQLKSDIHGMLVSDFSTTDPIARVASEIALMSTVKAFFSYRMVTECGIPEIRMAGMKEDWQSIVLKARHFQLVMGKELQWWFDKLMPVLERLASVFDNPADEISVNNDPFWCSIYKFPGGSGGIYVSGWINVLFPYLLYGNEYIRNDAIDWENRKKDGPEIDDFPSSLSHAPFMWEYFGEEYPMTFVGGSVAVACSPKDGCVHPEMGWAVLHGTFGEKL